MPYFISKTTTTYKDSSNNTGFTIDLGISSSVSLDINNFEIYAKYNDEDLNITYKGLDSSGSNHSLWGVIEGHDANLSITVSVIIFYYIQVFVSIIKVYFYKQMFVFYILCKLIIFFLMVKHLFDFLNCLCYYDNERSNR